MKIDIFDFDKFIDINELTEITNPITIDRDHHPTDDGLLSYRIFGRTQDDRKSVWAYINLGAQFIHPAIYKSLMRLNRNFENIVNGFQYYKLDEDGNLVESEMGEKGAGTGLNFLYKNLKKINFKRTDSRLRDNRIDIIKFLDTDELFTSNMLVSPPFIRDINLKNIEQGKISYDELNQYYSSILSLSMTLKNNNGFEFENNLTKGRIQNKLVEIYDYCIDQKIAHKNGYLHKNVMSKAVDLSNRLVISSPKFNYDTLGDFTVDYKTSGVPLSSCMSLFFPFVIRWISDFFRKELLTNGKYPIRRNDKIVYVNIKDPEYYMSADYIKSKIDTYIKYPSKRFDTIEFETEDNTIIKTRFVGKFQNEKNPSKIKGIHKNPLSLRYLTWTDIFYMACVDVTSDKHILMTRYPIADHFNLVATKIFVNSTIETVPMYVGNKFYKNYPKIDLDIEPRELLSYFIDTLQICVIFLPAMGGDFDGDQVTLRGLWSKEANEDAKNMMYSPSNLLGITNSINRFSENESIQAIYSMSKNRP